MADKLIEYIPGGRAEGLTPEDLAKKHGVDVSLINKQLEAGTKVEYEHSPDKNIAFEIAKDHLTESPFYYEYLEEMEEEIEENLKEDIKTGMSEEKREEQKPKKKATEDQVIEWLKKNPNPKDEKVHEWSKKEGFDTHALEAIFYRLATKYIKSMNKEENKDSVDFDETKEDTLKRLFG